MKKNILVKKIICGIFVVVASCIIAFSGCLSTTAKDTIELYNDAIKKTVEIRCSNAEDKTGYATGCVVSDDGEILTNKHVVFSDDAFFDKIEVRFYNSDNYIPAVIAKISETDDLALLKIDEPTKDCFLIGRTVAGGEKVYTIGNPNGYGLSFSEGVVSSPLRYVKYKGETIKTTQTSITINEGNSGGPLFNAKGELVGVVTFRLRTVSGSILNGMSFALHNSIVGHFIQ